MVIYRNQETWHLFTGFMGDPEGQLKSFAKWSELARVPWRKRKGPQSLSIASPWSCTRPEHAHHFVAICWTAMSILHNASVQIVPAAQNISLLCTITFSAKCFSLQFDQSRFLVIQVSCIKIYHILTDPEQLPWTQGDGCRKGWFWTIIQHPSFVSHFDSANISNIFSLEELSIVSAISPLFGPRLLVGCLTPWWWSCCTAQ